MPIYFLTCTTYGTWLHGDERGSFNKYGRFIPPNETLRQSIKKKLTISPFYLSDGMRDIVRLAFQEVADGKSWNICRMTVLYNHFHIVISVNLDDPQKVLSVLKSKATMRLRKAMEIAANFSPWTAKGNYLIIQTQEQLFNVCQYVDKHNLPPTGDR